LPFNEQTDPKNALFAAGFFFPGDNEFSVWQRFAAPLPRSHSVQPNNNALRIAPKGVVFQSGFLHRSDAGDRSQQ